GYFDIMNYHCYCSLSGADSKFNDVYNSLKTAGIWPKPIWITETGTGSTYSQQAQPQYKCASTDLPNSTACQQAQANYINDLVPHFLNGYTSSDGTLVKADKVFVSHQLDALTDNSNFCSYGLVWYGSNNYECGIYPSPLPSPLPAVVGKLAYGAYKNLIAASISNSTPTPTPTPTPFATPTPTPTPTPTSSDKTPPTVSISSPSTGSNLIRSSTVTISASATDNVAVSKVEFYVDGVLTCTDTTSAYTCAWNVSGKPNATYTLTAKAYDFSNNSAVSNAIITTTSTSR
ncbi:Ig-like domain-containing protein, partial [Candidatus Daviesbacteria bacterium]|nr:Ig-like domain-containing protein [Candidatus Daviesbacteria bacterium]